MYVSSLVGISNWSSTPDLLFVLRQALSVLPRFIKIIFGLRLWYSSGGQHVKQSSKVTNPLRVSSWGEADFLHSLNHGLLL